PALSPRCLSQVVKPAPSSSGLRLQHRRRTHRRGWRCSAHCSSDPGPLAPEVSPVATALLGRWNAHVGAWLQNFNRLFGSMKTKYLLPFYAFLTFSLRAELPRSPAAAGREFPAEYLSLDELTRAVLENNSAIKEAENRWRAAKERV